MSSLKPLRQQLLNTWGIWIRFHTPEIRSLRIQPYWDYGNGRCLPGAACQYWPLSQIPKPAFPSFLHADLAMGTEVLQTKDIPYWMQLQWFLDFMRAPVIQHFFEWCSSWDMTAMFQRDFHSAGWPGPCQLSFFFMNFVFPSMVKNHPQPFLKLKLNFHLHN